MELFSLTDLPDTVSNKVKEVHNSIKKKVKDYSCECPTGDGSKKKPFNLDKSYGSDDGYTPHPSKYNGSGVIINNIKFDKCQNTSNKTGHCITDIYTYDDFGLPVSQNTSSSSDNNLLYTKNKEYNPDPPKTIKYGKNCNSDFGCCADNRKPATSRHGVNCTGFEYKSGLTGSPVPILNNSSLGVGRRTFVDKSSGNSYMPYIDSNLPKPKNIKEAFSTNNLGDVGNQPRQRNICNIMKYAILICIVLIIILIICVYARRM